MDEGMSESQGSQETMSDISSVASGSESDSEHDNIDVDEFLRRNRDPKWDALFSDEPVVKPKLSLDERTRLREEKEKERIRLVRERGPALLPEDYVPRPRTPPEKIAEARAARYKAWQEKILRIQGECQTLFEENRRNKRAEYEKFAKLQKEYYPRDYYWKPDPLYYLHLKELGFSKIAIDKALFYTDNTSVKKALEYLKENPNPTELTKQEVMAAGEEVLKRIRPKKHDRLDPAEQTLTKESEMDIDGSQPLVPKNDSPLDGEANGEMKKPEEAATAFVFTVPKPVSKKGKVDISGKSRRGIKRTHSGVALIPPVQQSTSTDVHIQKPSSTEVHIRQRSSSKVHIKQPASTDVHIQGPTSTDVAPPLLVDKGEKLQLKMVLVVNASLLLDAVTLALEVGKVVANISSKLAADPEKYKIMFDEWIKEGHKMWMFRGENSQYLSHEYEVMSETNVIMYLSQCTHYRDIKTPSPSVLGVFGDSRQLQRYSYLPML